MMRSRSGLLLLPENKPAVLRRFGGELAVLWDAGIAKKPTTPTDNLATFPATFTRANLTSLGFVITERP